jgi:type IV pilus assembly protein PilM
MGFLPSTFGKRPRLACELRSEGVVAARAEEAAGLLASVSQVLFGHATLPLVRVGDQTTQSGFGRGRAELVAALRKVLESVAQRGREVTLIVPDAAVRVLLLDFDALPSRPAEALPVVRFRLRKLIPFEVEDAAVSYQVMTSAREAVQVMAVAMPRELLAEYESVVRDAGFEPGAVLPSTLAALAGLREGERPALVVNSCEDFVTTAIVRAGVLLLHRTVDLTAHSPESDAFDRTARTTQSPPPDTTISAIAARLTAAGRLSTVTEPPPAAPLTPDHRRNDIAQAVSVAGAYFEDTLESAPAVLLCAGTLGAAELTSVVDMADVRPVAVQEMMDRNMLAVGASTMGSALPLGWFAGARGALVP